jgi:hypothetical protein
LGRILLLSLTPSFKYEGQTKKGQGKIQEKEGFFDDSMYLSKTMCSSLKLLSHVYEGKSF